jgi:hypothetical protein
MSPNVAKHKNSKWHPNSRWTAKKKKLTKIIFEKASLLEKKIFVGLNANASQNRKVCIMPPVVPAGSSYTNHLEVRIKF